MHKPMFKSSNTQGFVRGRTSKLRFDRYIRRKLKPGEQLKFFCLHKRLGAGLDHEVRQYCTRTSKTRKKLKSSLCSVFFIFWLFSVLFCVLFCVLFLDLVTFRLFSLTKFDQTSFFLSSKKTNTNTFLAMSLWIYHVTRHVMFSTIANLHLYKKKSVYFSLCGP